MITNYTELKTAVAEWAKNDTLTSKMDIFCQLAEALINKDLRVLEMETTKTYSMETDFIELPVNYISILSVHDRTGDTRSELENVSIKLLHNVYFTETGAPKVFTINDSSVVIYPGGSAADPKSIKIIYIGRVPTLVSNSTNAILTAYPMVYFSAMMAQVSLFTQDEDELNNWAATYKDQIAAANKDYSSSKYLTPSVRFT